MLTLLCCAQFIQLLQLLLMLCGTRSGSRRLQLQPVLLVCGCLQLAFQLALFRCEGLLLGSRCSALLLQLEAQVGDLLVCLADLLLQHIDLWQASL